MVNRIRVSFSVWMRWALILYPLKNISKENPMDFIRSFTGVDSKCLNVGLKTEKRKESIFPGIQMETKRLNVISVKESIREP